MATSPPGNAGDEGPRDWRRRRRRRQPQEQAATPETTAAENVEEPDGGEEVVSRSLVSLAEPALDAIGVFGAPLLLAGIIGLVTGIVVVVFVSSMRLYGYIDIAIGASLIAVVAAAYISTVIAAFVSRTGRYGINTLILLAAFTGIVVILNFISFENTQRVDVTATNQFSLSERTKDLLDDLEQDIRATVFYKALEDTPSAEVAARRNRVVDTLQEFEARSGKFTYRVVDPDLEPSIVSAYFGAQPRTTGFVSETLVIENLNTGEFDSVQLTDVTFGQLEQDLVTSLYVATGLEQKTVYFLAGHGERNITSGGGDGYALLRQALEQENYLARSLVWPRTSEDVSVPEDAALVVVAAPTSDLPIPHAQALDLYLLGRNEDGTRRRENGSMIFLAEPDTPESWQQFLIQWGVLPSPGYVRDIHSSVPGLPKTLKLVALSPTTLEAVNKARITGRELEERDILQLTDVFLPGATALLTPFDDGARQVIPLAGTSPESYLISDPDRTDPITEGEEQDLRGPFPVALLINSIGKVGMPLPSGEPEEADFSESVVFGDADFVSNSNIVRGSNLDMFVNSTNYLLGDYSLVSIRPKAFAFREFNLDQNEYDFVRFSSWLFLPGIMALAAGLVWWIRR